jgi:hypothetical protein
VSDVRDISGASGRFQSVVAIIEELQCEAAMVTLQQQIDVERKPRATWLAFIGKDVQRGTQP